MLLHTAGWDVSACRRGPAEALDAVAILEQVAEGLSHVHAHKYVHRDLKMENILLLSDDSVKLADFGCAIQLGAPCNEFRCSLNPFQCCP